ncbi:AAA family ATPase [Vibrio barjaei]|uniref:AAA family ATPase n=1 Tax=Vibrio barjaei TaxID=1676683 RepID=UPI002284A7AC|nr:AAA family ATPase [Vibrio barjaei]MCY9874024.1 AAA family ATPase [Vibrio barjaei]
MSQNLVVAPKLEIVRSQDLTTAASKNTDYTLKGLVQSNIGLLLAAPGAGKSHFVMSLALECASGQQLLGLSAKKEPIPVLLIVTEDDRTIVAERYQKKINDLGRVKSKLNANLDYIFDVPPLVIPRRSSNIARKKHMAYLDGLVEQLRNYKLVIVDTLTEAVGEADDVEDERIIKNCFQYLAKRSGATILLVHHVNKDVIRGDAKLNMASGGGLTSLMRLSKYQLGLQKHPKDKNKRQLLFLKANYLSESEQETKTLDWTPNGTLVNTDITKERKAHGSKAHIDDEFGPPKRLEVELVGKSDEDEPDEGSIDDYRSIL